MNNYDVIVIGSGAAGIMSAITSAKLGNKVLLLEKLSKIASKLKATGGGRCNLTNTLSNEDFMKHFGRDGRFMSDALNALDHKGLMNFFKLIGVETHAPDGHRVFPISHQSSTIISALQKEMSKLGVDVKCSQEVQKINIKDNIIEGLSTKEDTFSTKNIVIATGGLGYPILGATGDGYVFAKEAGHSVSELSPAMMPLSVKETWVQNCRADTIAKAEIRVNIPKHKKLKAVGDLIFTKNGIRGPVVLDFARELTPLLKKYSEVPLHVNLLNGKNEEDILVHVKNNSNKNILEIINLLLPQSISIELLKLCQIESTCRYKNIDGIKRNELIKTLVKTPLTLTGHDGFKMAMITRGGVSLKEINPKTMQSKIIKGLYFCGEVVNLDGPCGGYNLQWSFSSGHLAGFLKDS